MLSLNLHFSSFVKHFVYVESQIGKCKYSKFRITISIFDIVFSEKTWKHIWFWSNVGNNKQIDFLKK